jgi:hypothetical protein
VQFFSISERNLRSADDVVLVNGRRGRMWMGAIIQGPWQSKRVRDEAEARLSAEFDRWCETFEFECSHPEPKLSYIESDGVHRLFAAAK